MISIQSILLQARSLPLEDRVRLAELLMQEAQSGEQEDIAVGKRGLAALTEATRGEDWSEFYPPELRQRKAG